MKKHPIAAKKAKKKIETVILGTLTEGQKFHLQGVKTIYQVVIEAPSKSDPTLGRVLCFNTKEHLRDFFPAGLEVVLL
jgi:hypothetical protein